MNTEKSYIKCGSCGRANKKESKFCNSCGVKLEQKTSIQCIECGEENDLQSKFCNSCGITLDKKVTTTTQLEQQSKEQTKQQPHQQQQSQQQSNQKSHQQSKQQVKGNIKVQKEVKKPLYKKVWFWLLMVFVVLPICLSAFTGLLLGVMSVLVSEKHISTEDYISSNQEVKGDKPQSLLKETEIKTTQQEKNKEIDKENEKTAKENEKATKENERIEKEYHNNIDVISNSTGLDETKSSDLFQDLLLVGFIQIESMKEEEYAQSGGMRLYTAVCKSALASKRKNVTISLNNGEIQVIGVGDNILYDSKKGGIIDNISSYELTFEEESIYTTYAKRYVESTLISPSTAKFPGTTFEADKWRASKSNGVVSISSYVDSKNSYGSVIRNEFYLQMNYDTAELIYMKLGGEVVFGKPYKK